MLSAPGMGRPLSPLERQTIAAWLAVNAPTRCPRSSRGLSAGERLAALRVEMDLWTARQRSTLEAQRRQRAATPRPPRPEVVKWHAVYWQSGLSLAALGLMVGRHPTTLHALFIGCGLPTRPRRGAQLDQAA